MKKKSPKKPKFKQEEAIKYKAEQGGAISAPQKKKKKEKSLGHKEQEALAYKASQGGAIRPAGSKGKKKQEKKVKSKINRFHDPIHRHLHQHLSGRGGRLDPPYVRKKMYELTKNMHPSIFHSYMHSKPMDLPQHYQDHPGKNITPNPRDSISHVIDTGGSMSSLTHSENGLLQAHDSRFYHQSEII